MSQLMRCESLVKRFSGVAAVNGVDFAVSRNEIVGVIGPNGSGKTTLFNCLGGALRPTAGRVLLGNKDVTRWRPDQACRQGVARTFQQPMVFPELTVEENVRAIAAHHARRGGAARPVAERVLRQTGLHDVSGRPAGQLSYGQKRALGVALALATSPTLVLMDEPAAGLNEAETRSLGGLVRIVHESGASVCLIDHDIQFVLSVCSRLVVLDAGQVIAQGMPGDVVKDPNVLRVYLGGNFAEGPRP